MKKILVLSSHTKSLFWFRLDMMKSFIEKGYDVVAIGNEPSENWFSIFKEQGITYRQINISRNGLNPIQDLKTLRQLKKIIQEEKPEKIFSYQAKTVVYGSLAAKSNNVKEYYSLIAGLGSVFRGKGFKNSLIKAVLKKQYKVACNNSQKVFFQNPDDRDDLIKMGILSLDKVAMMNGSGVNTEKFYLTDQPEEYFGFLFTGRLIKDKGIMEYLEACQIIKQKFPEVKCMVVGPYDTNPSALQPEEMKKYIDKGIIEYFGEQSNIPEYLNKCNVFVLPSYHEGTPKTILEAMAMGRAILTTDAPGCRETVVDGKNGFMVEIKNVQALVDKMEYFIENPLTSKEMGLEGLKLVQEKFDVKLVNQALHKVMGID